MCKYHGAAHQPNGGTKWSMRPKRVLEFCHHRNFPFRSGLHNFVPWREHAGRSGLKKRVYYVATHTLLGLVVVVVVVVVIVAEVVFLAICLVTSNVPSLSFPLSSDHL